MALHVAPLLTVLGMVVGTLILVIALVHGRTSA